MQDIVFFLTLRNVSFLDVSHPSQSDVEQPHPPVNHNRPFFYVQPPTQPYFMYQWPMDPFGQYGFLGPGKKSLKSVHLQTIHPTVVPD